MVTAYMIPCTTRGKTSEQPQEYSPPATDNANHSKDNTVAPQNKDPTTTIEHL